MIHKEKQEVYKEVKLVSGTKVEIMVCRGYHMSMAQANMIVMGQGVYDIIPFMLAELCLVNGEKKGVDYYLNLLVDDYTKICEPLSELLTQIS